MKRQQVMNNIMGNTVELLLNTVDWLRSLFMPKLVCILSPLAYSFYDYSRCEEVGHFPWVCPNC